MKKEEREEKIFLAVTAVLATIAISIFVYILTVVL